MEISVENLNKIIDMYFADLQEEVLKIVPKHNKKDSK